MGNITESGLYLVQIGKDIGEAAAQAKKTNPLPKRKGLRLVSRDEIVANEQYRFTFEIVDAPKTFIADLAVTIRGENEGAVRSKLTELRGRMLEEGFGVLSNVNIVHVEELND